MERANHGVLSVCTASTGARAIGPATPVTPYAGRRARRRSPLRSRHATPSPRLLRFTPPCPARIETTLAQLDFVAGRERPH